MPLINSHPLDLFRVSACRLDDNGGFLAYAPSPLLDIFAIFATINLGGIVMRFKDEMKDFLTSVPGKLLLFLFGIEVITLIWLFQWP